MPMPDVWCLDDIRCNARLVIPRRAATADQVAIFAEKGTRLLYMTKEGPLVEVEVLSVLLAVWPPSYSIRLPGESELEAGLEKDTEASRLFPLTYPKALEDRTKLVAALAESELDVIPGLIPSGTAAAEGANPAAIPTGENDAPGKPDGDEGGSDGGKEGEGRDGGDAALEPGNADGHAQQKKKQKPKKKTGKKKR